MRLTEIMRKAVETVSPSIPAGDAWQLMQLRRIHHLVVMNEHRVVGIFSDRDAGGMRGEGVRKDRAVADLMTPQVVTALPTTTIRRLANSRCRQSRHDLRCHQIHRLSSGRRKRAPRRDRHPIGLAHAHRSGSGTTRASHQALDTEVTRSARPRHVLA